MANKILPTLAKFRLSRHRGLETLLAVTALLLATWLTYDALGSGNLWQYAAALAGASWGLEHLVIVLWALARRKRNKQEASA